MGMPLDYLVAWLVSKVSVDEWALRLPSAIWGTLALLVATWFFPKIVNRPAALLATLFLALSPLHVQYSQELRFYAPLSFFSLAATALLFEAIRRPNFTRWAAFTLVAAVGVLFHAYVLLVLVTGLLWVVLSERALQARKSGFIGLLVSGACLGLVFLGAWFTLIGSKSYDFPLVYSDPSFLMTFATGLGWLPTFLDPGRLGLVLGALYVYGEIMGVVAQVKQGWRSPALLYLASSIAQIGLIVAADLATGYFFKGRQLLHLLPVFYLFAGLGFAGMLRTFATALRKASGPAFALAVTGLLAGGIAALNFPTLASYYAWEKNDSCRIVPALAEHYAPGTEILILPKWEYLDFTYYAEQTPGAAALVPVIHGVEWDDLPAALQPSGPVYLAAEPAPSPDQRKLLESLSFQPYALSGWGEKLWVRNAP
jgi:4-amino-4-deoxy-L-arabinose transferase-like glycosyltransferase